MCLVVFHVGKWFGLPDVSVKEAKERVRTAIRNTGYEFQSRKIVVNLAPADMKKEGTFFDLPMAVGLLINFEQINEQNLDETIFIGELSLDGKINKVNGVLPMCIEARKIGMKRVIFPKQNADEAAIVEGIDVIGVTNLEEVVKVLNNEKKLSPTKINIQELFDKDREYIMDFSQVKGQENIKRALEIAAARKSQCAYDWNSADVERQ